MTQSVAMINKKSRRQAMIWFIMAGVMLILWFLMSLSHATPEITKERQKTKAVAEDFALPVTIDNLSELSKEVPPIDFATVVRDLRNYPAQFKGKKFFEDNDKRWTVQVMDVAQNEIITEYLKGRRDRDKFAYFRYHNANNEQRYILTYGIMGSTQEALGAIKTVDFGLPKSVTPMPEEMKRYVGMIDNYERSAEVVVDSSESSPRAVRLKPTKKEIPAEAPKPQEEVKETPKKAVAEDVIADLNEQESEPTKQLKAPPTIKPKETAEKPKADTKNSNKGESQVEPKPQTRPEPTPEPKNERKPEPKSEKPAPTKEANVADLEPAPPMTMPGDD
ncbi:hypothetical protein [Moraxella bovis]|uniref:Uncharacterized protein n=1 Tax=Moraxella bovis TaxID=476 RepID=A0A378PPE5_MORBO|nr:hypothetical protein [Moraxella bovis]STY90049.1 Uncharacterised protein [Moraxella bovis]